MMILDSCLLFWATLYKWLIQTRTNVPGGCRVHTQTKLHHVMPNSPRSLLGV